MRDRIIMCPICGIRNSHFHQTDIYVRGRKNDSEGAIISVDWLGTVTVKPSTCQAYNPSLDRNGMNLILRCESDHVFKVPIYQHKGETNITCEFAD